jgi:hypothetical protein
MEDVAVLIHPDGTKEDVHVRSHFSFRFLYGDTVPQFDLDDIAKMLDCGPNDVHMTGDNNHSDRLYFDCKAKEKALPRNETACRESLFELYGRVLKLSDRETFNEGIGLS